MNNRKALLALAAALAVSLGTVAVIGGHDNLSLNAAGTETYSCGSITFGANIGTSIGATLTSSSLSTFTTSSNITVSSLSVTKSYYKSNYSTTADSYAARIAASGASGSLGFNFGTALTIKSARVYAAAWDSSPSLVVATDNTTASGQTIVESTAPSITDSATGTGKYYEYTLDSSATTSSLTLSCSSRVYILKIVLCLSGAGSPASSAASSSEASSSSSSSSSGTYRLVNKSSDIAIGGSYLIASAKAAGSADFLGNSASSSYYRSCVSGTILSDLTVTPSSTIEELTLGGSSSAYTLTTTKMSSGDGTLASDTSYSTDLKVGTSANTWTISFDSSTYEASIYNVDAGSYLEYTSSYFDCSTSSATVYLFVKKDSVSATPTLTLSQTSASMAIDDVANVTYSASGFSGTPTVSASSSDTSVATVAVSSGTIAVTAVKKGTSTINVSASYNTENASASIAITVTGAASVILDNTTLSLSVGGNATLTPMGKNFTGTPTWSCSSSNTSVASATLGTSSISISALSAGTSTITVTGTTSTDGAVSATCLVTVTEPTLTLSASALSVSVGSTGSVTATYANFSGTPTVTATSSSTSKATVAKSQNGTTYTLTVTGVATGSCTITVTAAYGTESDSKTIAVTVTAAGTGGTTTQYTPYRCHPTIGANGSGILYSVSYTNGMYRGTVSKTYSTSNEYIEQEDVAAYFNIFGTYPKNYKGSKSSAVSYGTNGRVVSTYKWGSYSGSNDYSVSLASQIESGGTYYELDIGTSSTNSNYNNGSSIDRGTYRVVAIPGGSFKAYANSSYSSGYEPATFYTPDHYAYFYEFYNYAGGFGAKFNAQSSNTRPSVTTIEFAKN